MTENDSDTNMTATIALRVNDRERRALEHLAAEDQRTVSGFIRKHLRVVLSSQSAEKQ